MRTRRNRAKTPESGCLLALILLATAGSAWAQVGPGEFEANAGADPSIGETSQPFADNPSAADNPSIGETSQQFQNDPSAADNPSIGETSDPFPDNPSAADNPSIGETSDPFPDNPSAADNPSIGESSGGGLGEEPAEGAPFGRLEPFGQ